MKLYYFPGSCALAPHIILEWLGIDFEAIRIEKGDPEYLKINPLGLVPALENGGKIYDQADAILHFLAQLYPDSELAGDNTPDSNYAINRWMAFLTGDLHPAFFPFFNPQRYTTLTDEEHLLAAKKASQLRIARFYHHLNNHLMGRTFMVGERRSIADAFTIPMLRWSRLLDKPVSEYQGLSNFLTHWEKDRGVQSVLQQQGLLD